MKTRKPVTINGKQYRADAVLKYKDQNYIAHDLARKLKRQAKERAAARADVAAELAGIRSIAHLI